MHMEGFKNVEIKSYKNRKYAKKETYRLFLPAIQQIPSVDKNIFPYMWRTCVIYTVEDVLKFKSTKHKEEHIVFLKRKSQQDQGIHKTSF